MFVFHFQLDGFLEALRTQCITGRTPQVYVTTLARTNSAEGYPTVLSSLIASVELSGQLHIAHIPIENAILRGPSSDQQLRQAVQERAQRARELVARQLASASQVRPGLLLEVGLWQEIRAFETTHGLWRWEGEAGDVFKRQLVAVEVEVSDD